MSYPKKRGQIILFNKSDKRYLIHMSELSEKI